MTPSLAGVTVLDLSRVLAGPYCAALLADLGADVLKVEDASGGGDELRQCVPRTGSDSAAFVAVNRGKRGVSLDLRREAGREVLRHLVARADVLVENFRPGTMTRLGLGTGELLRLNPRLVHCAVSAFGSTGPLRDAAGYEALLQAYSGVMSVTGEPGGEPVRCGVSFLDMSTGALAAFGVVTALLHRDRTGAGQRVKVSLLETAVSLLSYHAQAYQLHGTVAGPLGSGHPSLVPYRNFDARTAARCSSAPATTGSSAGSAPPSVSPTSHPTPGSPPTIPGWSTATSSSACSATSSHVCRRTPSSSCSPTPGCPSRP